MRSKILRNKIVSKAIILVLVMAIATPPAAFAETQAECEARKAQAIADAAAEVAKAAVKVATAAVKLAAAGLKALQAKQAFDACPAWKIIQKAILLKKLLAAGLAAKKALDNFKSAQAELKAAWDALNAALAIECDCEE